MRKRSRPKAKVGIASAAVFPSRKVPAEMKVWSPMTTAKRRLRWPILPAWPQGAEVAATEMGMDQLWWYGR